MDPLAVVGAGRAAAGRRFAFYISVQLCSVMVPGLVAVTSLAVLMLHARHPRDLGPALGDAARALHGPALIVVDVSWLAAAYVLGYVGRELAFRLLGLVEWLGARRSSPDTLYRELEAAYGPEALGRCLATHPLLGRLLGTAGNASRRFQTMRQPGGALRAGNAYEAFVYAKFWLREHSPSLAPDATEAEINVLLSTLLPGILGTWALIAVAPLGTVAATVTAIVAAAVSVLTFAQVVRLRRTECWEALRNLLEDHEMRLAVARLPVTPFTAGAGGPGDSPGSGEAQASGAA
ncbi:hypothetical protein ACF061_07060 [Streptomyces sp. NPDC015220]|uniref:hypothetical protein n=1 Tax=Streptomyces sp. NPDC015220 TaxID=3364947 RepID=UPI0036FD1955